MIGIRGHSSNVQRVVMLFFVGGIFAATLYAWVITRPGLRQIWFTKAEWWTFPTADFWMLAAGAFFAGVVVSYLLALVKGWLPIPLPWYRPILATALAAAAPAILSFLSRPSIAMLGTF